MPKSLGRPMSKKNAEIATVLLRAQIQSLLDQHSLLDGLFVLSGIVGQGLAMIDNPNQRAALMQDVLERIKMEMHRVPG